MMLHVPQYKKGLETYFNGDISLRIYTTFSVIAMLEYGSAFGEKKRLKKFRRDFYSIIKRKSIRFFTV